MAAEGDAAAVAEPELIRKAKAGGARPRTRKPEKREKKT